MYTPFEVTYPHIDEICQIWFLMEESCVISYALYGTVNYNMFT